MSGTQVSPWLSSNELMAPQLDYARLQALADAHSNTLLQQQQEQQSLGANEIEYMGRAAQSLLDLKPEQRAAAYPGVVQQLQRYGFAKNAPGSYPGDEQIQRIAALGIPSKDLFAQQQAAKALDAILPTPAAGGSAGPTGPSALSTDPEVALDQLMHRESGGRNIPTQIKDEKGNPASSASGLFQIIDPTWAEAKQRLGIPADQYPTAQSAPDAVQRAGAKALLLAHGEAPWAASAPHGSSLLPASAFAGGAAPATAAPTVGAASPGIQIASAGTSLPMAPTDGASPTPVGSLGLMRNPDGSVGIPGGGFGGAAPARAPAAAPTAAPTPGPAAPAATPAALPTPHLTNQDMADLQRLKAGLIASRAPNAAQLLQAEVDRRMQSNYQQGKDFLAAQAQGTTQAREAEQLRLQQVTSQREAEKFAQEQKDIGSKQDRWNLEHLDPSTKQYAASYQALAMPKADPQTGALVKPIMTAYDKPTYKPPGATEVPDYSSPEIELPKVMSSAQAQVATYADRMAASIPTLNKFDSLATDWAEKQKEKAGNYVGYNINSPSYQNLRAAQEAFVMSVVRPESGANVTQSEFDKYARIYFPQPGEDASVVELKRHLREVELDALKRQAGPAYKPKEIASSATSAATTGNRPPLASFQR